MSYLHLTRTRTRDRSPSPTYLRPLRRDTKHSRIISLSDDEDAAQDDYPYSSTHRAVRPSRALTLRNQPSQLERYNVWSERQKSEERDDSSYERELELERTRETRHTHSHRHGRDHVDDDEERAFRFKVQAAFTRPRHHHEAPSSSSHHHHHHHLLPTTSFQRKDKWVDEGWETRERSRSRSRSREVRRDSFWGEGGFWGDERVKDERDSENEKDVWSRYRRIKRTKTEEWRPLTGWRRI